MLNTFKKKEWLKQKKLVFFMPSLFRFFNLLLKKPRGPAIEVDFDVTCYWISSGTWGSYRPPNKIFICPYKIPNLKKVIRHEISHLKHNDTVLKLKMNHEDKERYINEKEKEDFNYEKHTNGD